jgi:hypothetical protein
MCLLFSKVFGFPLLPQGNNGDQDKEHIETQVRPPAHMAQDPAAGAGHPRPEMQQHQRDIAAEGRQQCQREPQAVLTGTAGQQQPGRQQFAAGQDVQQHPGQCMREGLVIQLAAERGEVQQLAGGGINKEQNKQQVGPLFFHKAKEPGAATRKQ